MSVANPTTAPPGDQRAFRELMGHLPTGVVVVTGLTDHGEPAGMAVNSITSVSLDPPLILFCAAHTSETWSRLRPLGRFCANVLTAEDEDLSRRFAGDAADRFAQLAHRSSPTGLPVIDPAVAWIECRIEDEHEGGDHTIVVGRVEAHHAVGGEPLVFHRGTYRRLDPAGGSD